MYLTEQEAFWAGKFGDEYITRNRGEKLLSSRISFFSKILEHKKIESCLEYGSNIGINLQAIKLLVPDIKVSAIEINQKAVNQLNKISGIEIFPQSILDFNNEKKWDLTFSSGVLIHINPAMLTRVYDSLYKHSKNYILVAEYYNPVPVDVLYRGNEGKLFKRDFAGELMDRYSDLKLIDYGFCYHRDNVFPDDDITWFLLKKS